MSAAPKMTPWFVNGEKPWEPGVYNVSCRKRQQTGDWWSYFDGKDWMRFAGNAERALGNKSQLSCFARNGVLSGSWRGLAEKP